MIFGELMKVGKFFLIYLTCFSIFSHPHQGVTMLMCDLVLSADFLRVGHGFLLRGVPQSDPGGCHGFELQVQDLISSKCTKAPWPL